MYVQTCILPYSSFVVRMLGRYKNTLRINHWKAVKKVLRYLQGMNDYIITHKRFDDLEVIVHSDSNFVGCANNRKFIFGYMFLLVGGTILWKSTKQYVIAIYNI